MNNSPLNRKLSRFDSSLTSASYNSNDSSEFLANNKSQSEAHSHKAHNENFNLFLEKINSLLIKKKYKSVIKLIEAKKKNFEEDNNNLFILYDIKMKCFFKIIKGHLDSFGYGTKNFFYSPISKNTIILEGMFAKIREISMKLIKALKENKNVEEKYKERIIQNYCEFLYYQAKLYQIKNQIQDCIAVLSIANNLFKNYIDNCKELHTIYVYQNILLFISALLIEGGNFQRAEDVIHCNIKLCFRYLFINANDNAINIHIVTNKEANKYHCVIQNLSLCLYQLGICFENLNQLRLAIEAYKQTTFFATKFLRSFNPKFCEIVKRTQKLSFKIRTDYIAFLAKREVLYKKKIEEEKQKKENQEKSKLLHKISNGEVYNTEKFSELQGYIETKLKPHNEPNTINTISRPGHKKQKSHYLSSTFTLYNDLLSRNYSKFINDNDNLYMNNLDKYTAIKLDTYNNQLLSLNHYNTCRNMTSSNSSKKIIMTLNNSHSNTLSDGVNTNAQTNRKTISTQVNNKGRNNSKSNTLSEQNFLSASPSKMFKQKSKNYFNKSNRNEKVIKYDYKNKYKYSKTYRKKISELENMTNKEIKFQKELLNLKKYDTYNITRSIYKYYNTVDENKVIDNADNLYMRLKSKVDKEAEKTIKIYQESRKNENLDTIEIKRFKLKESAIAGLNPKKFKEIEMLNKREQQIKKELDKKYLTTMGSVELERKKTDLYLDSITTVNNNNNMILSTITKDLENYQRKENHIKSQYNKT